MKKKIIFGLAIFALIFFLGGIYVVTTTETNIYELHRLSQLHRTVAMRKDLLLSIKNNQGDIILRGKRLVLEDATQETGMVGIVRRCLRCHDDQPTRRKVTRLKDQVEAYYRQSQGVFAAPAGSRLAEQRAGAALAMGDELIGNVEAIIRLTSSNLERQEREILREINRRKSILFALVILGPFFAVGLAFFLIRGLTRPLEGLLEATRRLKAGDLDHRLEGLTDEFGEVASSFNEMAASLKRQMLEMQRTEQLRVCGEMAAGLAHEIRNPLAGMKVSIEVLMSELNMEPRDRQVLEKVIEQIRHIELLMKNLLNYARPAAARPARIDVNKLVEQTGYFITRHPSFASGGSVKRLVQELDERLPEITGDPQKLQQVFLNLLLNAADATPDGGVITVRTGSEAEEKTVTVEVRDTGKGVPPEMREKIFQPFFTTKGKGKGTGLGLAVSKRIVEEHGGSIKVEENFPQGAVFKVLLPVENGQQGEAA